MFSPVKEFTIDLGEVQKRCYGRKEQVVKEGLGEETAQSRDISYLLDQLKFLDGPMREEMNSTI